MSPLVWAVTLYELNPYQQEPPDHSLDMELFHSHDWAADIYPQSHSSHGASQSQLHSDTLAFHFMFLWSWSWDACLCVGANVLNVYISTSIQIPLLIFDVLKFLCFGPLFYYLLINVCAELCNANVIVTG